MVIRYGYEMEDFDFSAPITTTVTFDDSDEETKPSVDITCKPGEKISTESNETINDKIKDIQKSTFDLEPSTITEARKRPYEEYQGIKVYNTENVSSKDESNLDNQNLSESELAKTIVKALNTTFESKKKKNCIKDSKNIVQSVNVEPSDAKTTPHNLMNVNLDIFGKNTTGMKTLAKTKRNSLDMPLLDGEDLQEFSIHTGQKNCNIDNSRQKIYCHGIERDNINNKDKNNNEKDSCNKTTSITTNIVPKNTESYLEYYCRYVDINKSKTNNTKTKTNATKIPSTATKKRAEIPSSSKKGSPNRKPNEQTDSIANINNNNIAINVQEQTLEYIGEQPNVTSDGNEKQGNNSFIETANIHTDYIKILLETVSAHMIHVWAEYKSYIHLYNSNSNSKIVMNARNSFLHRRRQFFDLSYSSVVNIILPRENDITFVKNFIDNTITLAYSKSYICPDQDMQLVFKDLINWVKMKKHNEKIQDTIKQKSTHPLLVQILDDPQKPVNKGPPPKYRSPDKVRKLNKSMNVRQSVPHEPLPSTNSNIPPTTGNSNIHPTYSNYSQNIQPHNQTETSTLITCNQPTNGPHLYTQQRENVIVRAFNDNLQSLQQTVIDVSSPSNNYNSALNVPQNVQMPNTQWQKQAPPNTVLTNQEQFMYYSFNSSQNSRLRWPNHFRPGQLRSETLPEQLRLETLRSEQLRPETLPELPGALRPDQLRSEALRPEQLRPEALRPEQLRPETLYQDQLRPETLFPEQHRQEMLRPGLEPLPDTFCPEQLRPEILRPEQLIPGTIGPETHRHETIGPGLDQLRPDTLRPEQLRSEAFRLEQQQHLRQEQPELQQEHINNYQLPTELQRSSLSRDSGFMSPFNFNGTNDQTCNNNNMQECMESMPLITHVTSLSTNATYINEGSCCVCGKTTRKMCLGCYNCYYCSHQCQYQDWKTHEASCKSM